MSMKWLQQFNVETWSALRAVRLRWVLAPSLGAGCLLDGTARCRADSPRSTLVDLPLVLLMTLWAATQSLS